ncbi:MAG: dethiobiotin synthase [Myxococcaceae bacterium]
MRFFVTGTDTGVGKTEVSAALLSAMARAGLKPTAWKPAESGGTGDSRRLWDAAGRWQRRDEVSTWKLKRPLAPALAAKAEGQRISWAKVRARFAELGDGPLVVEGAGGLFVPLAEGHDVIDLVVALKLPVVLVARAGLGTLNHTSLSLEALARRRVKVAAVVLSRGSNARDPSVPLNRPELERRFPGVRFLGPVPFVRDAAKRARAFERVVDAGLVRPNLPGASRR